MDRWNWDLALRRAARSWSYIIGDYGFLSTERRDGRVIGYQLRGDYDEAIVWLGGTGCAGATWHRQVDHFSRDYRCVVPDLPGIGSSEVPSPGTCTPALLADDMVAMLDALEIGSVHCVGFSLGAAVAQELALRAPERIASIVLIGAWASTSRARHLVQHFQARRRALIEAPREIFRAFGFWIWSASLRDYEPDRAAGLAEAFETQASEVSTDGYLAHFDADLAHDAWPRLGGIKCPALVIHGSEDAVTLPRYNREVADAIPYAELNELQGGGHMVWYEQPETINELIEGFLGRADNGKHERGPDVHSNE